VRETSEMSRASRTNAGAECGPSQSLTSRGTQTIRTNFDNGLTPEEASQKYDAAEEPSRMQGAFSY
jgi:hypothetical protein